MLTATMSIYIQMAFLLRAAFTSALAQQSFWILAQAQTQ
jgi:hypothetical protein